MRLTIDRIVDNIVTCEKEDRTMINLPLSIFPDSIKEGDIVAYEDGCITRDDEQGRIAKEDIEA